MSRCRKLLAACALVATLLAASATAATAAASTPAPSSTTAPATTTQTPAGVRVGPPLPATANQPSAQTTVNGDKSSSPPWWKFWDVGGQISSAIDSWFRGLVFDALNPMLDLVGKTVLSTPQLASNPQVAGLWQISLISADALLVLFVLVAAGLAMSHETMQTRYALKDLIRRLAFAGIMINVSLTLCGQLIDVSNALAAAFLGDGASAAASTGSLQQFVVGALSGGGIFLILLGLACAVAAVVLVVLYLLRAAIAVMLVCAAPLLLLSHLFPQTEGLAHLWWRALAAVLGIQIAQALVLAAAVRVFFSSSGGGLGLTVSGSLINLLLCLCLLFVLIKIPFWARQLAFGGRGGSTTVKLAKIYATQRVLRGGI